MTVPVPTLLTGSQSGTNATVYTTASVSAAAGDALVVFTQFIGGGRTVVVTLTTDGTAFTVEAEDWWNSGADEMGFHTLVLGSSYTGTLTITGSGGGNQCHWSVIKLDAGTFDPANLVPQWNSDFAASGGSFLANLASPVNSDSRTFCMAGHTVFEGTAEGPNMTQLSDSPGNSGGSPLGRGFEAAWRSDAFETTPILQGTSSVWGFLCVEIAGAVAGGTGYTDSADTTVTATTAVTDVRAITETAATTVTATTAVTDVAARADTVSTTGAVTSAVTDLATFVDTAATTVAATSSVTDARAAADTAATTVTATTAVTDVVAATETAATTIAATVAVTDVLSGAPVDYVDAPSTTIAATTAVTDTAARADTAATTVTATTAVMDARSMAEVVATVISATTALLDALAATELASTVIVATVTVLDSHFQPGATTFVIVVARPMDAWETARPLQGWAIGPLRAGAAVAAPV